MKREIIIFTSVIMFLVVFGLVGLSFGANVTDNGNGNQGYILVSTGNGHQGNWTDPSFLKGAKGDKGDQGIQGIQGLPGIDGIDGINGIDGMNGVDGVNGIGGAKGDKGDTGADGQDVDPMTVTNLQNVDTTLQNNINGEAVNRVNGDNLLDTKITSVNSTLNNHSSILQDHENRINNLDSRVSKLEKTQFTIRTELKFIREKHLELGIYNVYSTTRSAVSEVGINIVIPVGENYLDRENKKINARLDKIDRQLGNSTIIERTVDNTGKVKSIRISEGKVSVNGEF